MIIGSALERPSPCWVGRSSVIFFFTVIVSLAQLVKGQSAMYRVRLLARFPLAGLLLVALLPAGAAAQSGNIDDALATRAKRAGWSRVIVTLKPGAEASGVISKLGGRFGRKLQLINGMAAELPNGVIKRLAAHPAVARLDFDRPTTPHMSHVANIVGARYARRAYGYDGAGIGVAVVDSGVTGWHDDLTYNGSNPDVRVVGNQRVAAFVDFVNGRTVPYDDYGHGTHVSGIVAGNGHDSRGQGAGIAPASHLVSLKVLDHLGRGLTSDVIAAIEFAVKNRTLYNIRIINLSVGAAVSASYNDDPLTLAAKRAVDAGIVVVTAAGNQGRTSSVGSHRRRVDPRWHTQSSR
jgi:serine protease AprX